VALISDLQAWLSFLILALLEIVLGVDNIIFLVVLAEVLVFCHGLCRTGRRYKHPPAPPEAVRGRVLWGGHVDCLVARESR